MEHLLHSVHRLVQFFIKVFQTSKYNNINCRLVDKAKDLTVVFLQATVLRIRTFSCCCLVTRTHSHHRLVTRTFSRQDVKSQVWVLHLVAGTSSSFIDEFVYRRKGLIDRQSSVDAIVVFVHTTVLYYMQFISRVHICTYYIIVYAELLLNDW